MGLGSDLKKGLKKTFKPIVKIVKKIVKPIARGVRKIGRELKKGFGKVAKAFGKLGPLGSIALSLILPGLGGALSGWLSSMGPVGNFILKIGQTIGNAASYVKKGVGRVFSSITNGIEMGMNAVSRPFMEEGARGMGSAFRDFVSNATGGMVDKSAITGQGDSMFSNTYIQDASGKSFGDMTFAEREAFKIDGGFDLAVGKEQTLRDVSKYNANMDKINTKIDAYQSGAGKDLVRTVNPKTGAIEFRSANRTGFGGGTAGKLEKSFALPEIPKTATIKGSMGGGLSSGSGAGTGFGGATPAPGATDPTNMWSRLNDPDIGFYDAVKYSDNAKMYGRITALQAYDYQNNPDELSETDMEIMRNNGVKNTQRAQESLARVDANNYSTGPAPYQMVNANEMGNQDPYAFYLNQIYGQSFSNVNQSQQQYLAQNAPGYGATFQDFAMMSYV